MINVIIKELEQMISNELVGAETDEQRAYVAGLSDALDLIKSKQEEYVVGNEYYVVIFGKPSNGYQNEIIKMKLKRITTIRNRTYYCFVAIEKPPADFPSFAPELTLSNQASLKLRVHETREQAELYINTAMLARRRKR